MTPRLKAGIFVRATIRRAETGGAAAFVLRKGIEEAGAVYIKLNKLDGTVIVLGQARRGDGELVWMTLLGGPTDEAKAAAYFERQVKLDPDLWIVEIEDREGRSFLDEPIV
jgi:hypothetical protein